MIKEGFFMADERQEKRQLELCLYAYVPEWGDGEVMLRITDDAAAEAVESVASAMQLPPKDNGSTYSSQKAHTGDRVVTLPGSDHRTGGHIQQNTDGSITYARNPKYVLQAQPDQPDTWHQHGTATIHVSDTDLVDEVKAMKPSEVRIAAHGSETEYTIAAVTDDKITPVDVSNLITAIKAHVDVPISAEALMQQAELVGIARVYDDLVRHSLVAHKLNAAEHLGFLQNVCEKLGLSLIPTSSNTCKEGAYQVNVKDPHIRLTLKTIRALNPEIDPETLSDRELAETLYRYDVNGLHLTASLEKDSFGMIGDEMLQKVYEHTHPAAITLWKAMTHSVLPYSQLPKIFYEVWIHVCSIRFILLEILRFAQDDERGGQDDNIALISL